jgi:hypothetical protein
MHTLHAVCAAPHSSIAGLNLFGYVASSLVLMTFTTTSMRLLRIIGIASNIAFISYALVGGMMPILVLHSLLLPLNLFRLFQIEHARRGASLFPAFLQPATALPAR